MHKRISSDVKTSNNEDGIVHKSPTKKIRVDEMLLAQPPIQAGHISNDILLHNRVMKLCHEQLLAQTASSFTVGFSPQASMFLQMSSGINLCHQKQPQTKNLFDNRLVSIDGFDMHRYNDLNSAFGTNMMRQANSMLTSSNINIFPVIQAQLSPTIPSQLQHETEKPIANYGLKVIQNSGDMSIASNDLAHVKYNTSVGASGIISISQGLNSMFVQDRKISPKLPFCLAQPVDKYKLSEHQQFLRFQIIAFQATEEDVKIHTRGRNKRITLGQVGIRCRHCSHLPVSHRQKGSAYFPANTMGLYQAAQNMSTAHIQCGLCTEMPEYIKEHFKGLIATKAFTSGAGRPYWDKSAKAIGLMNSDNGIRFMHDNQVATVHVS